MLARRIIQVGACDMTAPPTPGIDRVPGNVDQMVSCHCVDSMKTDEIVSSKCSSVISAHGNRHLSNGYQSRRNMGTKVGLGELTAVGGVIQPALGADRSGGGELVLSSVLGGLRGEDVCRALK